MRHGIFGIFAQLRFDPQRQHIHLHACAGLFLGKRVWPSQNSVPTITMWSDLYDDYYPHESYFDADSDDSDAAMYDEDMYYDSDNSLPSPTEDTGIVFLKNRDSEEVRKPKLLQVPSLVDISSRLLALRFPFAYIEHRNPPVPDELQLKIISFSFPDNEDIIHRYAEFGRSSADITHQQFRCTTGHVKDMTQIGKLGRLEYKGV